MAFGLGNHQDPNQQASQLGVERMSLGNQIDTINWYRAVLNNPQAGPELRAYAQRGLEQSLASNMPAAPTPTPYGFGALPTSGNVKHGRPVGYQRSGPYSMGVNYDNQMNAGGMNPQWMEKIWNMNSPASGAASADYDNRMQQRENYLGQLNRDYRAPATYTNDPVSGERKLLWAPDQKSIQAQRDNFTNQPFPEWAKKDMMDAEKNRGPR